MVKSKRITSYNFNAVTTMQALIEMGKSDKEWVVKNREINSILDRIDTGQLKDLIWAFIGKLS